MRKPEPCLNLFIDDMAAHLFRTNESTLAFGARVKLWLHAWDQDPPGTLPNDKQMLSKWSGVTLEQWKQIEGELFPTWEMRSGRWYIRRVAQAVDRLAKTFAVHECIKPRPLVARWE